CGQGTHWPWTF
nr:immunoglobulin light chain junction region [Macaca mulatta]MOW61841.1 immunoglobulin light chain junction region [Macaca mulatta]MOW62100.1 immunoglobulin light chain junction region [Macaca mulatta]MOW62195.1 immunoglobulin light chain junction region [Macaca mulatta]MOW62467.1 immunoglobulin light chain junction region [Macaca mulatta]